MTADRLTPQSVSLLLVELLAAGDLDAAVDLYEPHALFVELDGVARSRSQIRAAHERFITNGLTLRLNDCVSFEFEDIALVHWSWTATRTDGSQIGGASTEVLRRQPDRSWRFIIDNSDGAAMIGAL